MKASLQMAAKWAGVQANLLGCVRCHESHTIPVRGVCTSRHWAGSQASPVLIEFAGATLFPPMGTAEFLHRVYQRR